MSVGNQFDNKHDLTSILLDFLEFVWYNKYIPRGKRQKKELKGEDEL